MENIAFSQDYHQSIKDKFYLKRLWTDSPGPFAFRSFSLAFLAYYSPLSDILHKLLYLFREPFYDYQTPDQTQK